MDDESISRGRGTGGRIWVRSSHGHFSPDAARRYKAAIEDYGARFSVSVDMKRAYGDIPDVIRALADHLELRHPVSRLPAAARVYADAMRKRGTLWVTMTRGVRPVRPHDLIEALALALERRGPDTLWTLPDRLREAARVSSSADTGKLLLEAEAALRGSADALRVAAETLQAAAAWLRCPQQTSGHGTMASQAERAAADIREVAGAAQRLGAAPGCAGKPDESKHQPFEDGRRSRRPSANR